MVVGGTAGTRTGEVLTRMGSCRAAYTSANNAHEAGIFCDNFPRDCSTFVALAKLHRNFSENTQYVLHC